MENTIRAAMHPADEFAAMAALIDAGEPVEAIATRFGVPNGTSGSASASARSPPSCSMNSAAARRAQGVTAFTLGRRPRCAARRVGSGQGPVLHPALYGAAPVDQGAVAARFRLGRLSAPRLTRPPPARSRAIFSAATKTASWMMPRSSAASRSRSSKRRPTNSPRWAWTRAALDPEYGFIAQDGRVRPQPAEFPPAIAAEIQEIEEPPRAGCVPRGAGWSDGLMAKRRSSKSATTNSTRPKPMPAVYAREGPRPRRRYRYDRRRRRIFVSMKGSSSARRAAARPTPAPPRPAGGRRRGKRLRVSDARHADSLSAPADRRAASTQGMRLQPGARRRPQGAPTADRQSPSCRRFRGGVLRPRALCALCRSFRDRGDRSRPLDCGPSRPGPRSSVNDLAGTPADRLLEALKKALDLHRLPLPPAEGFEAPSAALPPEAKQNLFAWCVAATPSTRSSPSRTGPIR